MVDTLSGRETRDARTINVSCRQQCRLFSPLQLCSLVVTWLPSPLNTTLLWLFYSKLPFHILCHIFLVRFVWFCCLGIVQNGFTKTFTWKPDWLWAFKQPQKKKHESWWGVAKDLIHVRTNTLGSMKTRHAYQLRTGFISEKRACWFQIFPVIF